MRNWTYRDLLVWQQAMTLVEDVYKTTSGLPRSEDYALTSQLRRAAVSIPSNIAEGSGRGTDRDQVLFLRIALGSFRELETQIEIARRVGYVTEEQENQLRAQVTSVDKLLVRLIASLTP